MIRKTLTIAVVLMFASAAYAQFELDWYSFDAGGTASGGDFELSFTMGQMEAVTVIGGPYEFTGGFWSILADQGGGPAGDVDCDGVTSGNDITAFVHALTDPAGYAAQFPDCDINSADLSNDGQVSVDDIAPFVALLVGDS